MFSSVFHHGGSIGIRRVVRIRRVDVRQMFDYVAPGRTQDGWRVEPGGSVSRIHKRLEFAEYSRAAGEIRHIVFRNVSRTHRSSALHVVLFFDDLVQLLYFFRQERL